MDEIMEETNNKAVVVSVDLHCNWEVNPPMYRLYVNDELFTERNYVWQASEFVTENLALLAPPGEYEIRIETPSNFNFKIRNLQCKYGKAQLLNDTRFRI
tara:strand:+ start:10 stop:309 length:300 start_codon:yes stop_codon:yes gene_type:complete